MAPVLRPLPDRWLDVAVVVEQSASMVIWQETVVEFLRLLAQLGAFRTLRLWHLATDEAGTVGLYAPDHATRHSPRELIAPNGRCLILVVTDGVSGSWRNGKPQSLLADWRKTNLVTFIHLLPSHFWERTALGQGLWVQVQTASATTAPPNSQLAITYPWTMEEAERPPEPTPYPVVPLQASLLTFWAKLVAGNPHIAMPALIWAGPRVGSASPAEITPEERLAIFGQIASPLARELAVYLAAAPLTLPLMRLVQRVMLPKSEQTHLAEFFLSGLIRRQEVAEAEPLYDFLPGLREVLVGRMRISDTLDVLELVFKEVSAFIDEHTGQLMDFPTWLMDETAVERVQVTGLGRPFARVALQTLRRLGGPFAAHADRVAELLSKSQDGSQAKIKFVQAPRKFSFRNKKKLYIAQPQTDADQVMSEEESVNFSRWKKYPITYRAEELKVIGRWIDQGLSGSVVALPGMGRTTLLNFLYYRRDALAQYLTIPNELVFILPIDLHILAEDTLATFYRLILRAFFYGRWQFTQAAQSRITKLFHKTESSQDPFVTQTALLEIFYMIQKLEGRVVCLLNPFDEFYTHDRPQIVRTLRGLMDHLKGTLCYIAGMYQEILYSPNPEFIKLLYNTLDFNVCWVRPLNLSDSIYMIQSELQSAKLLPTVQEMEYLWLLTGGYPNLLRMICDWWLINDNKPHRDQWCKELLQDDKVQTRLGRIWHNLTREEQYTLRKLQQDSPKYAYSPNIGTQQQMVIQTLITKGIYQETQNGGRIISDLFAEYIALLAEEGLGKIWLDTISEEIYQGHTKIEGLSPLERLVLKFLIQHPHIRLSHTELIDGSWPDDVLREGVSHESLYQIVRGLRKKIETDPERSTYIVNWRGQPEGGYCFFPEGIPSG